MNTIEDDDVDWYVNDNDYDDNWNKGYPWTDICEKCSDSRLRLYEEDIDWKAASKNENLTFELARNHKKKLDFDYLSEVCLVEFLEEFEEYINWKIASKNSNMTVDLITRHKHDIDFDQLSKVCSEDILREFEEDINFCYASDNPNLPMELIRRHKEDVNFDEVLEWMETECYITEVEQMRKEYEDQFYHY